MELKTWQQAFITQIESPTSPAQKIYAQSILLGKTNSLQKTFPATLKMIGENLFNLLAKEYCETIACTPHDIGLLGENLPSFIEQNDIADIVPYLSQLALFEWHWQLMFNAPPLQPTLEKLQANLAKQSSEIVLKPNDHCIFYQYQYAVDDLWCCCQPEYTGDFNVSAEPAVTTLLLFREKETVNVLSVDHRLYALFRLFDGKNTLDTVFELFVKRFVDAPFDLLFQKLCQLNVLT